MALDQFYTSNNVAEVRYWFTEWSPDLYQVIQHLEFDEAVEQLFDKRNLVGVVTRNLL